MSIELDPSSQLAFRRPLTEAIKETMLIRNPTQLPIAFKVKTTAPKQYCVRPNSGRVEPGQEMEIQIQMQALKEDPPVDFRCKDKFLVQSIAITAEREQFVLSDLWGHMEKVAKDQIREKKIRCVYMPPSDRAITQIDEESEHSRNSSIGGVAPPPYQESIAPVQASPVAKTPIPYAQILRRELEAAEETIQILQASLNKYQAEANTLRQRKAADSSSSTAPVMVAVNLKRPKGYPAAYVAAAALISFIISYLFF
ncbi:phosphatidylinositol-binding protein scs2 [Lunasporangiospora selenospora]|uniref:Phosphatidylinositol-binding protein scs2 n=1 Tax=Lunasporangiospora selenospora TaxID=979761 RepID=A0A9P6FX09_9FUNG|nr:phosphatidylinositol-binding protein scs2 [Lunasporangiospora selenospora]